MKKKLFSRLAIPFALGTVLAAIASAGPITLPMGIWETEPFTSMAAGGFFPNAYQAPVPGIINITGYYVTGDYYQVYVNGNLLLTTTQVTPTDIDYGDQMPPLYADPASAWPSGLFSTAQFAVGAGDLITIADLYPPSGIGEVGLQMVPEPSAFALVGIAGIAALLFRRKRIWTAIQTDSQSQK